MGAPKKHPFFGNQYTDGGYEPGSFTYDQIVEDVVHPTIKKPEGRGYKPSKLKLSNEDINMFTDYQKSFSLKNLSGKEKIILGGAIVAISSIGGVITYRILKKKKSAKENTIKLENVGVCIECGKPLVDSEFYMESDDNEIAYIACKNCGTKNYAHYNEQGES